LVRIASGERAAVQDCIDAYGGLVWSLARRLSPTPSDAEDAVQEIFIDLWKNAGRFEPEQAPERVFITMIARRRLVDRLRRARRAPRTEELSGDIGDPREGPGRRAELSAEAAAAAKALGELRDEQRRVLELSIYDGFTHQEIAQRTGMPLGTVKTHARRGLLRVREALGLADRGDVKEVSR
jgi:RNA polymerase sigma-70 factor (ECF subfamily)